jgi:2-oxoglutarate dehydrogenase E1 component
MRLVSSPLTSMDASSLEQLHEQYRRRPDSVDASFRILFEVLDEMDSGSGATPDGQEPLRQAIRARGHLLARLDPLAGPGEPAEPAAFAAQVMDAPPASPAALARRYAGTLTVETAHIDAAGPRAWLQSAYEALPESPSPDALLATLRGLIEADEFEKFLARKFPTKKRFGAEGGEAIIPLLQRILSQAAMAGVTHVVIGTMHRGRLNIMQTVLGKPAVRMLAEIKGLHPFGADPARAGDVPYHLGVETTLSVEDHDLRVSLLANPSHLEAVDPVALGRTRALQDEQRDPKCVLPIILHTDAAVVAQGVVAETLQLSCTAGFGTMGTLHIVINNRIGFTTEEAESRSSTHCTGPWKAIDSAILHVNADDPAACCQAADLALGYRQTHGLDAVIDFVCYRRNGHNEIDEPTFTQPRLYQAITAHTPVATSFAQALVAQGLIRAENVADMAGARRDALQRAYEEAPGYRSNESGYPNGRWSTYLGDDTEPDTGVSAERLSDLAAKLSTPPPDLALHPKLARILRQREVGATTSLPWPTAEALAFATLLTEGIPVRLTGQDVARGAFSHRHFGLSDIVTGSRHLSLQNLSSDQAPFAVFNSPLSEYAVLGFEYGYSLERPDGLVLWEAQFGDFANGAQVAIDQFVIAGEEKWCTPSGLVLLLPHGLEGQGPEHSSARIERYLQMAAKDNIRIANPSTPANYFHLLRRQALRRRRNPLIVASPKKLLRLPAAVSPLDNFLPGKSFQPVLASADAHAVITRVLVCSGKLAYDLEEQRSRSGATDTAIIRIEQLYPFPAEALAALVQRWPNARYGWVQEEPENMGAWNWLDRRVEKLLAANGAVHPRMTYTGRPESPSPAGSFHDKHDADQARIIAAAFDV